MPALCRVLPLGDLAAAAAVLKRRALLSRLGFGGNLFEELDSLFELNVLDRLGWNRLDLWLGRLSGLRAVIRSVVVVTVGHDNIGVHWFFDLNGRLDSFVHK